MLPTVQERKALTRLVCHLVEPESRRAVGKAAALVEGDLVELGLTLLEAIPPSPSSHVEGGQAGLAVLAWLCRREDATPPLKLALEAASRAQFPTSRRDIAKVALRVASDSTPMGLASLGLQMIDECGPYPGDGSAAGDSALAALQGRPLTPAGLDVVRDARRRMAEAADHADKQDIAEAALHRLLDLEVQGKSVADLAAGLTPGPVGTAVRVTDRTLVVGGVSVRLKRRP
ncbi:MAG: hypothetical protein AB1758_26245 [Candidatus Eremiobacterota bacterium]